MKENRSIQTLKLESSKFLKDSEELRKKHTFLRMLWNWVIFLINKVHDNHNVDIDEFFKYDWSRFEVMSFNNCGLRTADLVKISRNALEMLPNLKHLYLSKFSHNFR